MQHVKPSKTARIRQPERNGAVIPADGAWVPETPYYTQAINSGDLLLSEPQPPLPGAEPNPAPAAVPRTKPGHAKPEAS